MLTREETSHMEREREREKIYWEREMFPYFFFFQTYVKFSSPHLSPWVTTKPNDLEHDFKIDTHMFFFSEKKYMTFFFFFCFFFFSPSGDREGLKWRKKAPALKCFVLVSEKREECFALLLRVQDVSCFLDPTAGTSHYVFFYFFWESVRGTFYIWLCECVLNAPHFFILFFLKPYCLHHSLSFFTGGHWISTDLRTWGAAWWLLHGGARDSRLNIPVKRHLDMGLFVANHSLRYTKKRLVMNKVCFYARERERIWLMIKLDDQ
jgi:hypothetical protein